jgi:hypothetical protein
LISFAAIDVIIVSLFMQDDKSIPEQTSRVTAVNSSNWRRTAITIGIIALIAGTSGYLLGIRTNKNTSQSTQRFSFQPSPTIVQSSASTPAPRIQALTVWLEMPSEVKAGTTVPLTLKVKNISDNVAEMSLEYLAGRPARHGFSVTRQDGKKVWSWRQERSNLHIAVFRILQPGEGLTIQGQWQQVDNKGNTVPPGTYFVRGMVYTLTPRGEWLETEPKALTIVP